VQIIVQLVIPPITVQSHHAELTMIRVSYGSLTPTVLRSISHAGILRAVLTLAVFQVVAVSTTPVTAAEAIRPKEIPALEVAMKSIGPVLKMEAQIQAHTSPVLQHQVVMWRIVVLKSEASVYKVVYKISYHR